MLKGLPGGNSLSKHSPGLPEIYVCVCINFLRLYQLRCSQIHLINSEFH